MTDTPPSINPIRWAAQARKHWADATEIKPGVFSVMEGSGPKAQTRDFTVIKRNPHANSGWQLIGRVSRPGYHGRFTNLDVPYIDGRSWKITAPANEAPQLIAQLIEIARAYA